MDTNLERLRRQKEKMPNYREVMELAEKILLEKQQVKAQGSFPPLKMDPMKIRIQMEEGFPYLRPGETPLSSTRMEEYFLRMLNLLKEQNPAKHEALMKKISTRGVGFEHFLHILLENRLAESGLSEEFGEEGSLLFFFIVQALKPTLEVQAENWRKEQKEFAWNYGYCPFCGGLPGMGEIRGKEGKRVLHCSLCATEWDFPRMKCPYCQNEDQEKFTYFQVEGETEYRVDICLHCKRYLKTVDSRDRDEVPDWEVEDYLTLHLDHLAQEEGYARPLELFIGVR
ncbi:MAG: formate dehydrogenase accessory protein FdhE [Deltaproteobacteria bacterium]|nr:formate dehydrogenase accessory protein FdhE [Deltaproteobacteria bacterium]